MVELTYPGVIQIEITNLCNSKCVMCPVQKKMARKREIMPLELFENILKKCRGGMICHPFLNGESLIVENIADYFRLIKEYGLYNFIYTSCDGLTEELSIKILEEGLLDEVIFSIDAANKEKYESIRIGLKWDDIYKNVTFFINERNKRGGKPRITIQAVSDEPDLQMKMVEVWKGVDALSVCPKANFAGQLDKPDYQPKDSLCPRLYSHLTVLVDGRCCLCCYDYDGKVIVGDLNREEIPEIWHSEKLTDIRSKIEKKQYSSLELCGHCTTI